MPPFLPPYKIYLPSAANKTKTLYGDLAIPPRCNAMWHTKTFISPPLWKSRTVFLSQNKPSLLNFIFTRMQCHCYYLSSHLLSTPTFICTLLKMNFPFLLFPYRPNTLWLPLAPLPELTARQQLWWAVVLFQAPQAGKLCQSESLCFLITAVRSKPKLAIHEVTFILFPTLFLCPRLPELRFLSLLPALLGSKNRLSEVVTKTVWIQVTAKDLYYLQLAIF